MPHKRVEEIIELVGRFHDFQSSTLPLCAAENPISSFAKIPLSGDYHERYIMGGIFNYSRDENFIGSDALFPFYGILNAICAKLYNSSYADARTLSGMHCLTTLLMSLTGIGEKILILNEDAGGHGSVKGICERLGLETTEIPFDYEHCEPEYDALNALLEKERFNAFLYTPSDIITPPDFKKITFQNIMTVLYDATQTLGLIAGKVLENPLDLVENMVLFGGTHKTIPGPSCGLVLTNSTKLSEILDSKISPQYMRHPQMHHVLSLLFTLYETDMYGQEYQHDIVKFSNSLASSLHDRGFDVACAKTRYTDTHQIFIRTTRETMNKINERAIRHGITLNKKSRKIFGGNGIRLGVQEITRYGWFDSIDLIAEILHDIAGSRYDSDSVKEKMGQLPQKGKLLYTFDPEDVHAIRNSMKNSIG